MSWQPMRQATPVQERLFYSAHSRQARIWKNDTYTAIVEPDPPSQLVPAPGWVHLSVRRNDRAPIRDWRDLQQVKNDCVGSEREAIEIYPAESRLVDCANQYHLWVLPPDTTVGVGFSEGLTATPMEAAAHGARQRAR